MEVLVLEEKEDKRSVWNKGIKDKLFGEMVRKPVLLEERKKMRIELIEIPCTARWYTDALINLTMMCSFLLVTQLDTRKKKPKQNGIELHLEQELNESFEHFQKSNSKFTKKKERRQKKLRPERENSVSLGLGVELWLAKKSGVRRA